MATVSSTIWAEKHRPDTLSEVKGNDEKVKLLQDWVDDDEVPNILFAGPSGTGKTASAVAFAKDKYGDEWQDHFLQLNASDDRGIDVVRNEVKDFARLSTVSDHQFKLIFLDEADALTRDAQPALRRVMEDFSDRTRFILSCNYPNQIIDPIQSRCGTIRMEPLSDDEIADLLQSIILKEGVEAKQDQLEQIVAHADGDARNAIHTLQMSVVNGELRDEAVSGLTAFPDHSDIEDLVNRAIQGDHGVMGDIDEMINNGMDVSLILEEIMDVVKRHSEIPADGKMKMMDKIGECEYRVKHGSSPRIQLHSLMADLRVARHISLAPYRDDRGNNR